MRVCDNCGKSKDVLMQKMSVPIAQEKEGKKFCTVTAIAPDICAACLLKIAKAIEPAYGKLLPK